LPVSRQGKKKYSKRIVKPHRQTGFVTLQVMPTASVIAPALFARVKEIKINQWVTAAYHFIVYENKGDIIVTDAFRSILRKGTLIFISTVRQIQRAKEKLKTW
jgi:hypothetical protein